MSSSESAIYPLHKQIAFIEGGRDSIDRNLDRLKDNHSSLEANPPSFIHNLLSFSTKFKAHNVELNSLTESIGLAEKELSDFNYKNGEQIEQLKVELFNTRKTFKKESDSLEKEKATITQSLRNVASIENPENYKKILNTIVEKKGTFPECLRDDLYQQFSSMTENIYHDCGDLTCNDKKAELSKAHEKSKYLSYATASMVKTPIDLSQNELMEIISSGHEFSDQKGIEIDLSETPDKKFENLNNFCQVFIDDTLRDKNANLKQKTEAYALRKNLLKFEDQASLDKKMGDIDGFHPDPVNEFILKESVKKKENLKNDLAVNKFSNVKIIEKQDFKKNKSARQLGINK